MRTQPWEELEGIEAWGKTVERCCASCQECFFPGFWPTMGRSGEGLWRVTGHSCPLDREEAVERVHRLVEAFGTPAGAKLYESPALLPASFGYRWDSPAGRLQLDIRMWCELEECRVFTEAYRCEPPDVLEGVDLEANPEARVFEIRHYVDDPNMTDDLFVEIYSDCFHADGCCKEAEANRFWPLLEREAEARGVTTVFTSVVDCSDNWSRPTFSTQEDGSWELTNSECEPPQCRADEPAE